MKNSCHVDKPRVGRSIKKSLVSLNDAKIAFNDAIKVFDIGDQINNWDKFLLFIEAVHNRICAAGLDLEHPLVQKMQRDRNEKEGILRYLSKCRGSVQHGVDIIGGDIEARKTDAVIVSPAFIDETTGEQIYSCLRLKMGPDEEEVSPRIHQTASVRRFVDKDTGEIKEERHNTTIENEVEPGSVFYTEKLKLIPVMNEKKVYNPPTKHIGKKLTIATPSSVGQAAIDYYECIIEELQNIHRSG